MCNSNISNVKNMPVNLKEIKSIHKPAPNPCEQVSILKKLENVISREIHFGSVQVNDKKKESFYSEMGILLSSGIDIRTVLDIIADEQNSGNDKKLYLALKNDIVKGAALSDAINTSGKFSPYEFYSIIFTKLNNQYNDELEHRIGMLSNLLEPIMIIVIGLLVAVILISMYLPLFQLSSSIY